MMTNQEFIESGIIEQYVLGNASDSDIKDVRSRAARSTEVFEEIERLENLFFQMAENESVAPRPSVKNMVLGKIARLHQAASKGWEPLDLKNLPLITPETNYRAWAEAVAHIKPTRDYDDIFYYPLREEKGIEQAVLFVKKHVDEEVHHDFLESFMILEGSCECQITSPTGQKRSVFMQEGDFLTFQLGEDHDIHITSPQPTKGILQRVAI